MTKRGHTIFLKIIFSEIDTICINFDRPLAIRVDKYMKTYLNTSFV